MLQIWFCSTSGRPNCECQPSSLDSVQKTSVQSTDGFKASQYATQGITLPLQTILNITICKRLVLGQQNAMNRHDIAMGRLGTMAMKSTHNANPVVARTSDCAEYCSTHQAISFYWILMQLGANLARRVWQARVAGYRVCTWLIGRLIKGWDPCRW